MRLVDFKVRVIDGRDGTGAKVRVFIESRDHEDIWSTIGVSEDIIEASWQALADSFQFKLAKKQAHARMMTLMRKAGFTPRSRTFSAAHALSLYLQETLQDSDSQQSQMRLHHE